MRGNYTTDQWPQNDENSVKCDQNPIRPVSKICPDQFGPIGPFILGPLGPGYHILHTSKSSSNELDKNVSCESSGNFLPNRRKQGKSEGFESCDQPIVRKRPIWVKIGDVLSRVTLKFDGWPWKTIGHLSFAVSSFVQHFIAIGEFKLELQSRNAQFGSNSMGFFTPCDLEIWRMTLKNNRAPLLCYFKLCASFRSHRWFQTWVTVWKHPIWVKFDDF